MKNSYLLLLVVILFSMPDTRLVGFTTQTILLGVCLIFSILYSKSFLEKSIIVFNSPFIFLFLFSFIIFIFTFFTYNSEDISYIFARIRELLLDFLLIYLIYSAFDDKIKFIKRFIELFFIFNLIYYLIKSVNSSILIFFHQSVNTVYNYESFLNGREAFLGWEPSYIVPVSIILCLIYLTIYTNKLYAVLILFSTIFIFFMGLSKTSYILVFLYIFFKFYFYLNTKILNKVFIKNFIIILFILSTIAVLIYIENEYHIFTFNSTNKSDQYELISFLTRSILITESINQFINFPFGYGYGNSIIILSEYIDKNIMDFLLSYEIIESSKYARSPKSQLIEYILSGGIIFLILFVFYHIMYLNKQLKNIDIKTKQNIFIIIIVSITTILFGERIPYLLFMNFLFMIILQKKLYKEKKYE